MPNWDTSLVSDMSGFTDSPPPQGFFGKTTFNGDLSRWDTSEVTSMQNMFTHASAFNQDIGGWNTEKVMNMYGMFEEASAFNQDIGRWNTEKVENMESVSYTHLTLPTILLV